MPWEGWNNLPKTRVNGLGVLRLAPDSSGWNAVAVTGKNVQRCPPHRHGIYSHRSPLLGLMPVQTKGWSNPTWDTSGIL